MEETNVTMTTEETQGEPAAKENETKAEKFIRIGEYRMNKAVDAIGRLENLANRGSYEYTQEQVDAMFQALEGRVAEIKARFTPKKTAESIDIPKYGKAVGTGTLIIGVSLVLGFIVSFWSEEMIAYITHPAVVVGLGFILYGQFKYNKGIF